MESFFSRTSVRYSLIALLVVCGALGFAFYHSSGAARTSEVGTLHYTHKGNPYPAPACTAFGKTATSPKSMLYVQSAQNLSHDNRFDDALGQYVDLATVDPTYPGVNLDISLTLSKLNRPDAAKKAIESQMAASACVAQLPAKDLDAYCKAESYGSTPVCVKALGLIKEAAYYQAGLVETALGGGNAPAGGNTNASVESTGARIRDSHVVREPAALISRLERKKARREVASVTQDASVASPRAARRASGSDLSTGAGTDAALGAYSK